MASAGLFRRCFNRRMLHLVTSSRISTPLRLHRMIRTSSRVFEVDGLPIEMPALSPTMEEGKITKWLKNEGDPVQPGDTLCEIETDKAIVSMDTEEEGILAKILVSDGTPNVKIGTLIALIVAEGENYKDVVIPNQESKTTTTQVAPSSPAPPPPPTPTGGDIPGIPVTMPALSPTMEVGTIVKWLKKEGDTVHPGDYLCDIETDKNVNSMDTEEEGILAKILVAEGTSNVAIGSLIALIVEEGSDYRNVQIPAEAGPSAPSSGEVTVPDASTSTAQAADNKSSTLLSPAVRVLLEQHNLNINDIIGSGHHGRVLKGDLLKVVAGDKTLIRISKPASIDAKPKSPGDITVASPKSTTKPISTTPPTLPSKNTFTDLELNNMRKTIARRLLESKQSTPHAYATVDCRMDEVLQLRKNLAKENVKVSVNDFLIKAIAVTLKNVPEVNATWAGDSVKFLQNIDISVAVATPNGLITPIVKSAASKGLMDISNDIKDLASRAREGKLQLDEFQGGSFTISNLGMFGIHDFTAIINPPQACILAVGTSRLELEMDEESEQPIPRTIMSATLCSDCRVVDDHLASKFLEVFKKNIENPARLSLL